MKKVIVGITGNEKEMPSIYGLTYVAVVRDLTEGVTVAGGLPIVIPIGTPDLAKDYIDRIDKLILSGGQNVSPHFYQEEQAIDSDDYLLARDRFELALIEEALKQGKPIFAVCRGMQLLNVALGGSLQQEVRHHWQETLKGTFHGLQIRPNSRVSQLFHQDSQINSFHRQSIKQLAPDLQVTARDPRDGTIEAVEGRGELSVLGVQWHPEFLCRDCESNRQLFDYIVHQL
ncbi:MULTISPECIES: gamma-glutamyl-gamma-aminobutyrate hydrolase family protein [unclassified Streptococcus]|uniref:gamma-glutamyl-gamma-aminobutyrate hydrolase family protein n=1 Tax=unclassified Streptococcus TaxID=2608887 RepID=UPI001072532C|nr:MULTISPECIES: gamma-glutamyl-gamma-aminobutyrate hydrolase family protein [unclassified Streptococcus]MBF0787574.1 gamma-glutamyl-gamma-aminobutyrate hydrolase family protein [Streptococcus sp. 19428wC2_LYSM12]MCQ9211961.1 gamma-glutamyl-gamma-aminobutyrate hydrolase family protein [Streptococcus sp. B01]MCQ9213290.1 gamma-glutamyl-gamma-aminobutyrate hydrolase family protein [Streptococcus sp. O1]TFV05418.1 gamma-glutamyl-gamma-aminobutyrate hydrolase family protein [Streptococcus sp. LYSM1